MKFTASTAALRSPTILRMAREKSTALFYSDMTEVDPATKLTRKDGKLYHIWPKTKWAYGGYHHVGWNKRRVYGRAAAEKVHAASAKRSAKAAAKRQAEHEARMAASREKLNADLTDDQKVIIAKAKLVAGLQSDTPHVRRSLATLADMVNRGEGWGFTEKMIGAMDSIANRIGAGITEEKKLAKAADDKDQWIEEGRYEITGEVLTIKEQHGHYGVTEKMLIKDGLRKFWSSIPRGLDPERGDTVTFKGTVTRSNKDNFFGLVKRPVTV